MSAAEDDVREMTTAEAGTLAILNSSEINQQIATAHKFPRSVKRFLQEAKELVTLTEQTAEECIYALPRKERDQATGKMVTKNIEGPSARFAEIMAHSWGNARAGARVVDDQGDFVTAQGVFHDLEKNVAITYEVRRRIVNRDGHRFSADMIGVTANAACSIALRNAVLKGIPKALWNPLYESARQIIMGDAETLANRRSQAMAYLQKFGATQEMILKFLGVEGIEDVTLDHLVTLRGIATAIREGETTVERAFADPEEQTEARVSAASEKVRRRPAATEKPQETPKAEAAQESKPEPDPAAAPAKESAAQPSNFFLDRLAMVKDAENAGQLDYIAGLDRAELSENEGALLEQSIANKRKALTSKK